MKKEKHHINVRLSTVTVSFVCITVAVTIGVCLFLFLAYDRALINIASVNTEQSAQQTTFAVQTYLDEAKEKLSAVSEELEEVTDIDSYNEMLLSALQIQDDIFAVTVYDTNGDILSCICAEGELKENIFKDLSFDKNAFSSMRDHTVLPPHVQSLIKGQYPWVITVAQRANLPVFGGGVYIAIDYRFSSISKYIDGVGVGSHGYCYIVDSDGGIIYHPQEQLLNTGLKTEDTSFISELDDGVYSKNDLIYAVKTASKTKWRTVCVNYADELKAAQLSNRVNGILISVISCIIIAVLMSVLFTRIFSDPVRELVRAMKNFELSVEKFTYRSKPEILTEIQSLSDSFDLLVKRTKRLMEKVRQEEISLRKTELKALQAQINPHFLYNTLDSIQWMCEQGNNEDAVKMVGALARLFRISISRGREFITIKEEMQHAESYLVIQGFRYKNQFSYEFSVDKELENCYCNKITLQPLIENAIYHGIGRMVDKGRITINVRGDSDGDILMTVEDNGVGMTEDQCRSVLQKERSDSSGIGIKNVNDRLQIYFGRKYGISIESELDVGTKITVRLPRLGKEPENEV